MKKSWTGLLKMNAIKLKIIKFLLFFCLVFAFAGMFIKDIELFQSSMIAFLSLESVLTLLRLEKLEEEVKEIKK